MLEVSEEGKVITKSVNQMQSFLDTREIPFMATEDLEHILWVSVTLLHVLSFGLLSFCAQISLFFVC